MSVLHSFGLFLLFPALSLNLHLQTKLPGFAQVWTSATIESTEVVP